MLWFADSVRKVLIEFMGSRSQIFSPVIVRTNEGREDEKKTTYKLLVMHQDGLLVRVHVELDDITLAITVQKLITCTETQKERN